MAESVWLFSSERPSPAWRATMITCARILPFCIGLGFVTTFGCGSPMGAWEGEEVGQIGIALSSVPSDGTCLRFTTTAGTRSFQQTFDAVADSPLTAALH